MVSDPSNDVDAYEDFLKLIVTAHILAAIMAILGMETLDDNPSPQLFPEKEAEEKTAILQSSRLNDCTDFSFPARTQSTSPKGKDHVHEYAKEVLALGLFFLDYKDAIREGDGAWVFRSWKYMYLLLFFRATGHKNYTIEAFTLLAQHYFFPPRLSQQLLWSGFINTQGKQGHNIPADLHMEHLNRSCKDAVSHLGANKTPNAIVPATAN